MIGSPNATLEAAARAAASTSGNVQETIKEMQAMLDIVMQENKVLKERLVEVQGAGGGHGCGHASSAAVGPATHPFTGTGDPWSVHG